MYKNGLIRKIRLILKFLTSQTGQQTIAMHILPNISRSKSNQTMKFDQLIEYKMWNILLKNHTQSVVEKLFTDPYLKKCRSFKLQFFLKNLLNYLGLLLKKLFLPFIKKAYAKLFNLVYNCLHQKKLML